MKTLLILIATAISFSAAARSLHPDTFVKSYSGFSSAEATLDSAHNLCPPNARCITDGTVINLSYQVSCATNIVSFNYKAIEIDSELHVFTSAVIGHSPISGGPVCLGFKNVKKQITLINQYGDVVIHDIGVQ